MGKRMLLVERQEMQHMALRALWLTERKIDQNGSVYAVALHDYFQELLAQSDVPEPAPDRGEYVTREELANVLQRELGWHLRRYHEPK